LKFINCKNYIVFYCKNLLLLLFFFKNKKKKKKKKKKKEFFIHILIFYLGYILLKYILFKLLHKNKDMDY